MRWTAFGDSVRCVPGFGLQAPSIEVVDHNMLIKATACPDCVGQHPPPLAFAKRGRLGSNESPLLTLQTK